MSRERTELIVSPHIQLYLCKPNRPALKGIPIYAVRVLLSLEQFEKLMNDPIRNKGPSTNAIYPWNVIDYLSNIDPRKQQRKS
jgi:hypothetical protein